MRMASSFNQVSQGADRKQREGSTELNPSAPLKPPLLLRPIFVTAASSEQSHRPGSDADSIPLPLPTPILHVLSTAPQVRPASAPSSQGPRPWPRTVSAQVGGVVSWTGSLPSVSSQRRPPRAVLGTSGKHESDHVHSSLETLRCPTPGHRHLQKNIPSSLEQSPGLPHSSAGRVFPQPHLHLHLTDTRSSSRSTRLSSPRTCRQPSVSLVPSCSACEHLFTSKRPSGDPMGAD